MALPISIYSLPVSAGVAITDLKEAIGLALRTSRVPRSRELEVYLAANAQDSLVSCGRSE